MEKEFNAHGCGTGKFNLSKHHGLKFMKPTEVHLKEDGSIEEKPSLTFVLESPFSGPVMGEISLKMLNEGLGDIGYEIVPRKK